MPSESGNKNINEKKEAFVHYGIDETRGLPDNGTCVYGIGNYLFS